MLPKNKVHVTVIKVREFNENKISNISPLQLEKVITEVPRTKGQKSEHHKYHFFHFHLRNFLDDGNVLTSILYYISILSGPLFAATAGSFLCLMPMHNVLEHPEYWYEEVTCRILAAGILYPVINLIRTEYWSNLFFGKRVQTYMLFIAVSPIVLFSSYITYLYFWNIHLELFLPMPLNHIVGGSVLLIIITVFLRFRYTSQVFFCLAESLEKSFSSVHTCM